MDKAGYVTFVELDDEDEAGLRRASSARRCGSPVIRLEFADQEPISVIFNLLDGIEVSRSGEADAGCQVTSVRIGTSGSRSACASARRGLENLVFEGNLLLVQY